MTRQTASILLAALTLGGCAQLPMESLQNIQIPNYDPRPVTVPASCEGLIEEVAAVGMEGLSESRRSEALFCQGQMLIRSQEEETAARRLEADAEAARFALQIVSMTITGVVAVLAWVF